MAIAGVAVGAILSEIHGLLHEAKSNVEIDPAKGKQLIDRLASAETKNSSGALTQKDITDIVREVGDAIQPSIEKEISIDNPEAAVIQIRGLLDQLAKLG